MSEQKSALLLEIDNLIDKVSDSHRSVLMQVKIIINKHMKGKLLVDGEEYHRRGHDIISLYECNLKLRESLDDIIKISSALTRRDE